MATDIRKLNLDDLLGRLYYANVNHEWDEGDAIKAEIARRIGVRDRVVNELMEDLGGGPYETMSYIHVTSQEDATAGSPRVTYKLNGEQIL